jgi:hypothetical protein
MSQDGKCKVSAKGKNGEDFFFLKKESITFYFYIFVVVVVVGESNNAMCHSGLWEDFFSFSYLNPNK